MLLTKQEIFELAEHNMPMFSLKEAEFRICDFAEAVERAVLAKAGEQEPIYMWRLEDDGWMECTKEFFYAAISAGYEKRIVYAQQLPAQSTLEGYALAPLDPDEAMIDAGVAMALQVSVHGQDGWSKYITGLYKQMIAARPKF